MVSANPTNTTYDDYTNDTWYDNHWGGDTGDNEYVELPPPEVTDNDEPTGYKVCCLSSYLVVSSVLGMMTVQQFKHKRLEDE